MEAVQTEGEFPLGSKGSLDFSADTFGETDRKWYDLIRQAVLEKQHHEEENYGRPKKLQGITLYGALLDDFYELALGSRVERKTGGPGKEWLEVSDEAPRPELELRKDETEDGTFHGVILRGRLPSASSKGYTPTIAWTTTDSPGSRGNIPAPWNRCWRLRITAG